MAEFQQGMILRDICNDKHYIYIQDIAELTYGFNCIVYSLSLEQYVVSAKTSFEPIKDTCPMVNVVHTQALMIESYKSYIEKMSQESLSVAENVLKYFKQLQGAELLLTDDSVFAVKEVSIIDCITTTDWMGRIQFEGVRRSPDGHKRVQIATLRDLKPNSILSDALCKPIQERTNEELIG